MTKRLAKLEKYLLVNEKYYTKFRELGTNIFINIDLKSAKKIVMNLMKK